MEFNQSKNKNSEKIPKPVHLWQVDGFVNLSDRARDKFEKLIKEYGMCKLAKQLGFDKETVYSIYCIGRKRGAHSIPHLIKIANKLNYPLEKLEYEITHHGGKQTNMYIFKFPFILTPLHLRAVTIHGDGSYDKVNGQTEYYQGYKDIHYFEDLLKKFFNNVKARRKDSPVYSITVPSILVKVVCKSLNLELNDFQTEKFFYKVSELPLEFKFQVFSQFIVDEGHFKGTTFTLSQKKQNIRKGFIHLLESLDLAHSRPKNNRQDITIYGYNYPKLLKYLNQAVSKYGKISGFWFKEKEFREICNKSNIKNSINVIEGAKINREIYEKLKNKNKILSYQDIKDFGRNSVQVNKAIRNWKKNKLIKRIGFNKYRILK